MSEENKSNQNTQNARGLSDMSIFLTDESLAKTVSIVNGSYPQGEPFRIAQNGLLDGDNTEVPQMMSVSEPGILALEWIPSVGIATNGISPINRAGTKNYREFRNANWTQNYFDIADVSYYLIATSNVMILYNLAGLVYKHLLQFKSTNLYTPKGIIMALGFDFDDVLKNQARLETLIKQLERKIAIFAIPKSFKILDRWLSMVAHIYKDRDLDKAQYIVFSPKYLFKYDIATARLVPVDFRPETPMTIEVFEAKVEEMLNALYPDEEMMHFNADVTNYITKDIYQVKDLDWANMTEPIYDPTFMEQLHNADILNFSEVDSLDITQQLDADYNSIIVWNPIFTSHEVGMLAKRFIDVPFNQPDTRDVFAATRWKFTCELIGNLPSTIGGSYQFHIKSVGTEILMNPRMWIYDSVDMHVISFPVTNYINVIMGDSSNVVTGHFAGFARYSLGSEVIPHNSMSIDFNSLIYLGKINGAPLIILTSQGGYGTTTTVIKSRILNICGETANLILLEDTQLDEIQKAALISVFGLNFPNKR